MEGTIDENVVLDCAVFQVSSNENRYEAAVCSKGRTEKVASGPLNQLVLHLPKAKEIHEKASTDSFKLHVLLGSTVDSSWFTKSTLARFLNTVNAPEALNNANAIENEMAQLEDTRKFQLTLYADHSEQRTDGITDIGCKRAIELTHELKVVRSSSDATKNELLRAMDLRITVLKEELVSTFNRAAGCTCSNKQVLDIAAFAQYFGAVDLRNSLLKYKDLCLKDEPANPSFKKPLLHNSGNNQENKTDANSQLSSEIGYARPVSNGISPAKIAQVERQSSTESEESSDTSDDQSHGERSRPMIRSATPRRSASPMRRIQIGRSGSRRSTPLTIKSLNYFPARERIPSNRDVDEENSGDESEGQPKKTDNAVRRMSVQDAISLFESKQKAQPSEIPRRTTAEVRVIASKSVLRRWSAGMGDSLSCSSQENSLDTDPQNTSNNPVTRGEEMKLTELKAEPDSQPEISNVNEGAQISPASEVVKASSAPIDDPKDQVMMKAEEVTEKATASAEWSRQKEAELNEMLMRMMESKTSRHQVPAAHNAGHQELSNEQRGGLYSQYKEKRDEKLRAENAGKRAAKEAQFKVMQETLEQSKAEMASKSGIRGKKESINLSQKPRRNSSPPVLTKKEASKPTGTRKASPKSSPFPTTRNSSSSGPLQRTTGTQPTKPSPGMVSTSTPATRRKPQLSPSPTRPSPRAERQVQAKANKGTVPDAKPSPRSQENKQAKESSAKSGINTKIKTPSTSSVDSVATLAKPSFYSKVTKKSSVVPLESKPFLKKGAGIGPGVGPVVAKNKAPQSDECLKSSENLISTEEKEATPVLAETTMESVENGDPVRLNNPETDLEELPENNFNHQKMDISASHILPFVDNNIVHMVELPGEEIQPDAEMGISSAAWVEAEPQEVSSSCDSGLAGNAISPELAPLPSSSPRIRHSLSQMLQADNSEPEIVEWGNAEIPPALVYQKDAPKGLKRLLKFARKSKGEANVTGWASPSGFSEGEDDAEESKVASKRNPDSLRKVALQAKSYGQNKTMLSESFDGGNSSRRPIDYRGAQSILSAQSSMNTGIGVLSSDNMREGNASATASSTKATRSFFSLSTFRSGKSNETKLR